LTLEPLGSLGNEASRRLALSARYQEDNGMAAFEEKLADVARRAQEYRSSLVTEEATKTALVMPFISQVLGYDVFNPSEVVPEFVADLGLKKGEKIDYAIMRDGRVNILIEAKKMGEELSLAHASQLVRYFHTSDARIGVLTNGRVWNFYTDLDKPNILDERPFLVLDLLDIDPVTLPNLQQLAKESFDLDSVIAAAEELKYVSALKREIAEEFATPSEEFVRLFAKRVYGGYMNARAVDTFRDLTEKAARQYVNDRVNSRLKTALADQGPMIGASIGDSSPQANRIDAVADAAVSVEIVDEDRGRAGVVTTDEENEAYLIIKAILAGTVPMSRVFIRDAASYCSVILDDNNRRPIVRLYFDGRTKRIVLFDAAKTQTRIEIESLEDIYAQAEAFAP